MLWYEVASNFDRQPWQIPNVRLERIHRESTVLILSALLEEATPNFSDYANTLPNHQRSQEYSCWKRCTTALFSRCRSISVADFFESRNIRRPLYFQINVFESGVNW